MMPPTSIDGTDITGATIDGTDVQEITVDGDTVFSAGIPQPDIGHFKADSLNLSNGNSVTTWTDESTHGVDLSVSGGNPIFEANSLNGLPGVDLNGGDFQSDNDNFSFSQPIVNYFVFDYAGVNDDAVILSATISNVPEFRVKDGNKLQAFINSVVITGTVFSTGPSAIKTVFDGSNSSIELNGTVVATGDVGSGGRNDGYTFGDLGNLSGGKFQSHSTMYEFAGYQNPSAQVQSDVESGLSSKWGVTF